VMNLAFDVARQVLRSELSVNRESMLPGVREALDLAGSGPNPQLLLHPDDVEFVARHLEGEIAAGNWRICADPRVDQGGCRVSTANGSIDATLALRWRRVAASLGRDDAWEK
jgi:flagellar assembly protein FliH